MNMHGVYDSILLPSSVCTDRLAFAIYRVILSDFKNRQSVPKKNGSNPYPRLRRTGHRRALALSPHDDAGPSNAVKRSGRKYHYASAGSSRSAGTILNIAIGSYSMLFYDRSISFLRGYRYAYVIRATIQR